VAPQLAALRIRLDLPPLEPEPLPDPPQRPQVRAFVPIWRRPWMTLNRATYGSSMLAQVGVGNVFADADDRYPTTTLEAAAAARADLVVAPSEPYPFRPRHRPELEAVARVVFVDGQDLFWWGARTPAALIRLGQASEAFLADHRLAPGGAEGP